MKKIIILLAILLIGCATTVNYEEKIQPWVGKPFEQYVKQNGGPDKTFNFENGEILYTYFSTYIRSIPDTPAFSTHFYSGAGSFLYGLGTTFRSNDVIELSCRTEFLVNTDGNIKSFRFSGNNCE